MLTLAEPVSLYSDAEQKEAAPRDLQQEIVELEERLTVIGRQLKALRAALDQHVAQYPYVLPRETTALAQPLLQRCAADVVRLLREKRQPLGTVEILDELAGRQLCWRESTVRHVLADLKSQGVIDEGEGHRRLSYSLARR